MFLDLVMACQLPIGSQQCVPPWESSFLFVFFLGDIKKNKTKNKMFFAWVIRMNKIGKEKITSLYVCMCVW